MPQMRWYSGESTIPDKNPNQISVLEAPPDNPVIPGLLSSTWVSCEYSWDSLRVLPLYKVVTLFLAK